MKKITFLLIIFSVLFWGLISCSDDNKEEPVIYDISFVKKDFSVGISGNRYIPIEGGSKDYIITSGDESIIKAHYIPLSEYDMPSNKTGSISVDGLKKGSTTLTIKDNVTRQVVILNITVTQRYLNLDPFSVFGSVKIANKNEETEIMKDILENASLKDSYIISLIANEQDLQNNKLYMFSSYENAEKGNILYEGNYDIEKESDNCYLKLNFIDKEAIVSHKYLITDSENSLSSLISYLNFKSDSQNDYISFPLKLKIKEDLTDIYKPKYPKLSTAVLAAELSIDANNPSLAIDLVK